MIQNFVMPYVVLSFGLLFAFISMFYGIKILRLNSRVRKWDRAWAHITEKSVMPRKLASSSRAAWTISATYTFTASGLNYTGNKIFLVELMKGEKGYLKPAAQRVVDKMPEEVEIYYNPENPEECVMYADSMWIGVMLVFFTFICLLMGVAPFLTS